MSTHEWLSPTGNGAAAWIGAGDRHTEEGFVTVEVPEGWGAVDVPRRWLLAAALAVNGITREQIADELWEQDVTQDCPAHSFGNGDGMEHFSECAVCTENAEKAADVVLRLLTGSDVTK